MTADTPRRVVRVVPNVAGVRRAFDYIVPVELGHQVVVGTSVRVVLHNRRVSGWVVADGVDPPPGVRLQPILGVRGVGPPEAVVDLAGWAAWRWAGPVSRLLGTASAPTLVRSVPDPAAAPRVGTPGGSMGADLAAEAMSGGVTVVRLAPAHDPIELVSAAVGHGLARGHVDGGGHGDRPSVLVLAPAQEKAARVAGALRRAGHPVALLPGQWAQARAGGCAVVGVRAAAFAPAPVLSAAVVLDAHDEAYHEERAPTWAAWQVVAERARRDGASCALVSPCPTLDVLAAGRLVTRSRLEERAGWPVVEVADRRADDPRSGLYSERLVRLVRWAADAPARRVLCVLNRTGGIRLLVCATCGELARCEHCGAAVEALAGQGGSSGPAAGSAERTVLHCRRCGLDRPGVCARCGSTKLRSRRVGVSRARQELEALAQTPVAEVTAGAGGDPVGAAVVVGTEAVLHRVTAADAVAFLDFDAELLAPRLRAAEESLALLARAARVVARGGASTDVGAARRDGRAPGRLLVQTRQPQHPALVAAVSADPGVLAAAEAPLRAELRLPPVTAMALVSGPAADAFGRALAGAAGPAVEVRGPVDGVWSLRADDHAALCDLLDAVPRPPGRLRVEVDPVRA